MREGLNGHSFLCVISRYILEDLRRRQWGAILDQRGFTLERSKEEVPVIPYLVVANKPNAGSLIILIVGDHNVISSYLQQISLVGVEIPVKRLSTLFSTANANLKTYPEFFVAAERTGAAAAASSGSSSPASSMSSMSGMSSISG